MRVFSATHRGLEKVIAEGSFRGDLFYRLDMLNLETPPSRGRGHDILLPTQHLMQQVCAQIQHPVHRLTPSAYSTLLDSRWPGSIRQLQNAIFRAITIYEDSLMGIGDLEAAGTVVARRNDDETGGLKEAVESFGKALLGKLYVGCSSTR